MDGDLVERKHKYTAEIAQMKEYYEGEFEVINQKNVKRMFFSAILTGFYLLYVSFCEWLYMSGNISANVLDFFRIVLFISILTTSYLYMSNIYKALFHKGYMYSAEQYFNYNCIVGNPIKNVYVINSKKNRVIYIMRGIRFARLDAYTVSGGVGRARVVDTIKKLITV